MATLLHLVEVEVTEQLINTLPWDVQIWVQERNPTTSSEAGRLADDHLQARTGASMTNSGNRVDRGDRSVIIVGRLAIFSGNVKSGLDCIRIR